MSHLRECDMPFLKEDIDKLVQHHVDFQDVSRSNNLEKRAEEPHTTRHYKHFLGK